MLAFALQPELDELGDGGAALRPHQFLVPGVARILAERRGQRLLELGEQRAGGAPRPAAHCQCVQLVRVNRRWQAGFDLGRMDDQRALAHLQFPGVAQAQVITVSDRHLHLHGGGAQIEQAPATTQGAGLGERLRECGGGQFQVEFTRQLGNGRDKSRGQVFLGEGWEGWRGGWFSFGSLHEPQGCERGAASDEDRGEVLVFDKALLSGEMGLLRFDGR